MIPCPIQTSSNSKNARTSNLGGSTWPNGSNPRIQNFIIGIILFNALVLGLETDRALMARHGLMLHVLDKLCLVIFGIEIASRLLAYRFAFWKSGWNIFDFAVVAIALVPGAGPWAVLRSLRVLRVMRLLTVVPALRRVVAAFLHSIPGLSGVMLLMAVFLYTSAVLATNLFGDKFPEWFGSMGGSLFSLFKSSPWKAGPTSPAR